MKNTLIESLRSALFLQDLGHEVEEHDLLVDLNHLLA